MIPLNSKQGQLTAVSMNCLIFCHNSHIKENTYSPCKALTKRNTPALNGRYVCFSSSFCLAESAHFLPVAMQVCFPLTASHLPSPALPSPLRSGWLFSSSLLSPTRWKTHLSNTGRSSHHLSSSPVAKNEALLCKQVGRHRRGVSCSS